MRKLLFYQALCLLVLGIDHSIAIQQGARTREEGERVRDREDTATTRKILFAVEDYEPEFLKVRTGLERWTGPPAQKRSFSFVLSPRRYLLRFDTGALFSEHYGPRAFLSYSHAESDKWKGPGESPRYADSYGLGFYQRFGNLSYDLYYNRSVRADDLYRGFTFEETKDSRIFRRRDYSANLTYPGNPTENVLYYEFYRDKLSAQDINLSTNIKASENLSFRLRAYYRESDRSTTGASIRGSDLYLAENMEDFDTIGASIEPRVKLSRNASLSFGYIREDADTKNWRPSRKIEVNPNGSYTLRQDVFSYEYIQRTQTEINASYVKMDFLRFLGRYDLEVGLDVVQVDRDFKDYETSGVGYHTKDGVYSDPRLTLNQALSLSKTYTRALPKIKIETDLKPQLRAYASYSKMLRVPLVSIGTKHPNTDLSFVQRQLTPEQWDNYVFGLRFSGGAIRLNPSISLSLYDNRFIRLADSTNENISLVRNAGKVQSVSLELYGEYRFQNRSTLYLYASQTQEEFKESELFDGISSYQVKGKDLPDTPQYLLRLGFRFTLGGFFLEPTMDYIGPRYGNLLNTEKTDSYLLLGLNFNRRLYRNITLNGRIMNLTDTKYISRINPGPTKGTYFAGPPIAPAVFISGSF